MRLNSIKIKKGEGETLSPGPNPQRSPWKIFRCALRTIFCPTPQKIKSSARPFVDPKTLQRILSSPSRPCFISAR